MISHGKIEGRKKKSFWNEIRTWERFRISALDAFESVLWVFLLTKFWRASKKVQMSQLILKSSTFNLYGSPESFINNPNLFNNHIKAQSKLGSTAWLKNQPHFIEHVVQFYFELRRHPSTSSSSRSIHFTRKKHNSIIIISFWKANVDSKSIK
jgi:hypothetical protein